MTKKNFITKCQEHLSTVQDERKQYSKMTENCKLQRFLSKEPGIHACASFVGTMHQSFDNDTLLFG